MTTQPDGSLLAAFRETMAGVCTPVTVITAERYGLPYGTTVSAFTSLSMAPPMIAIALDRNSDLLGVIRYTGTFGVNVLNTGQASLAVNFARKGGTGKFTGIAWHTDTGLPRLPGAAGFLACRVARLVGGGDHLVVLADVVAADNSPGAPLTYHKRVFGTHTSLGEAPSGQVAVRVLLTYVMRCLAAPRDSSANPPACALACLKNDPAVLNRFQRHQPNRRPQ